MSDKDSQPFRMAGYLVLFSMRADRYATSVVVAPRWGAGWIVPFYFQPLKWLATVVMPLRGSRRKPRNRFFNFETALRHSFWPFSKRVPAAMRTPSVQWSVCGLLFCQGIGDALEFEGHRCSADCERNVDGIIIIIV